MCAAVVVVVALAWLVAPLAATEAKCRDVNTVVRCALCCCRAPPTLVLLLQFPLGTCGKEANCYNCLEREGCGWCGGSGCGITSPGCYNASERFHSLGACG